jgi:hypothetical protein
MRRIWIAALMVSALTGLISPWISPGVLAQAGPRNEAPLNLSVTFSGYPQANGWFKGPVLLHAQTDDLQASLIYSLDGGPAISGQSVILADPGLHTVVWNACQGTFCRESVTQLIKIEFVRTESLTYNPASHKWSFSGMLTETRQVYLLGMTTQVAKVISRDFYAWVILNVDTEKYQMGRISLGNAQVGDLVRVSISGPFVTRKQVDWNRCQPRDAATCWFGWLYDDGPLSGDWNIPLSPSNEFIHFGHPNPSWEQALFWNTEKVSIADDTAHGRLAPDRQPGNPAPRRPGCLALRGGTPSHCRRIAAHDAAGVPFLVESPGARGARGMHPGGNLSLAEWDALSSGRSRVPSGADGNLLAGNAGLRLL